MTTEKQARTPNAALQSPIGSIPGWHLTGLVSVTGEDAPAWTTALPVPDGWNAAHVDDLAMPPVRLLVCGANATGGWDACETVTVFRCQGDASATALTEHTEQTLRDIGVETVGTQQFPTSGDAARTVRSSGFFTVQDQRIWTQRTVYLTADASNQRFLVEHVVFVQSSLRPRFRDDIADLSDAVFLALTDTADSLYDAPTTPMPVVEGDSDGP